MKKIQIFTKLLLFYFIAQPVIAQETHVDILYKAYAFCENNGYMSTEAYIESEKYITAICSNMPGFTPGGDSGISCYVPEKHFIVVKSLTDNKIVKLPTWPQESGYFPKYIYIFESVLNGIHYQIKTTGGSNSYNPNDRFWTSVLLKKGSNIIYSNRINKYYGNIGMGC
ncbi:hypothetical protein H6G45_05020 [Synechocystis sp. FACHB-383]|uniref:hypothetical protein n=1 Tax=Synechocystis sp. FACHB-383 TaxID=2692864 RepID=UPI001681DAF6|nr:hypothetical protein [Synechocystis sp. FACHB-383]MBD2652866.1 hypothetical protein [Synechocystis sp. FACHB-383]